MATTLMTADEFARLDNDHRYDLIRGELITMSPTGGIHGEIVSVILIALGMYIRPRKLGKLYTAEAGFILARDPDVVLCPDVAFVRADRLPPSAQRVGFLPLAPDLAVEVVSPSDRRGAVQAKIAEYQAAGVPLLWVVYPRERMVVVHVSGQPQRTIREPAVLDGGEVLPGFCLSLDEIFGVTGETHTRCATPRRRRCGACGMRRAGGSVQRPR